MAEQTGLRNNGLPYPIYGAPWGVVFPMLDADGDLVTGATTPDAEVSKNGDTFADCTNESTEIATTSGMYYLLLTGTEMTADVVAVIAKSATAGMKTTALVFYPRKLPTIRSGTSAGGAAGSITLDASAVAVDDYYNGMVCQATIDGNVEVRVISDYVGSTKVASVVPNWNVTPDTDDTFIIMQTEGWALPHIEKIYSDTTIITSDLAEADTSDILSRLTVTNSNLLIIKSDTSDIRSALVISVSDTTAIHTLVTKIDSDQASQFVLLEPFISDTFSDTTAIHSLLILVRSDTTHIESDQASQFVVLEENTSDTESALVKIYSDTTAIEAGGGALTVAQASQLAKIASDMTEVDTSDIQSLLTKVYSDTTVLTAGAGALTSDQDSKLTRVANAIVEVDTSDIHSLLTLIRSDTAHIESDAAAIEVKLGEADTSDILSMLTKVYSDTTLVTATARGEPGQATPPASSDILTKIDYIYKSTINKHTQTATTFSLFDNAGATVDQKAAVSDDGTTFTREKLTTGP